MIDSDDFAQWTLHRLNPLHSAQPTFSAAVSVEILPGAKRANAETMNPNRKKLCSPLSNMNC
jgi:hypothetical protein